jgi:hypothetical protein
MTQKNIDDRYNSVTGLRHDLLEIKRMFTEADTEGLKDFKLSTKDVSSYFNLPNHQIGRKSERETITRIIEDFCSRHKQMSGSSSSRFYGTMTFNSSEHNHANNAEEALSEVGSAKESLPSSEPISGRDMDNITRKSGDILESPQNPGEDREAENVPESSALESLRGSKPTKERAVLENNTHISGSTGTTSSGGSVGGSMLDGASSLLRSNARPKKNHRCEVIVISGAAGRSSRILGHVYIISSSLLTTS